MDEPALRLFIAVTLPENIRDVLSGVILSCRSMPDRIKWVEPHNLHLTLKFLGDVRKNTVNQVCSAIATATCNFKPFVYELQGLSCFPNLARPRVFFVGTSQGASELQTLALNIEEHMTPLGFEKENRDFKAHITLGRFKPGHGKPTVSDRLLAFTGKNKATCFGSFTVSTVTLMNSTLTHDGPVYTSLYTQSLQ